MRSATLGQVLPIATALLLGCGGPKGAEPGPAPSPTHGGMVIRITPARGFVEIVNQTIGDARSRRPDSQVIAYFLHSDGNSAMTPPPADVEATLLISGQEKSVKMVAEPKDGDPLGRARYTSPVGQYGGDRIEGVLSFKIGSESLKLDFRF